MFWGWDVRVKQGEPFSLCRREKASWLRSAGVPAGAGGAGRCLPRPPATLLAAGACPADPPRVSSLSTGTQARKATAPPSPGSAPLSPSRLNRSRATVATVRRGGGGVGDLAYPFHI